MYHSVSICSQDCYLTTFFTLRIRLLYRVASQGFFATGDRYTGQFVLIIADIPGKIKYGDDTTLWDFGDLETHWWRMTDFLESLVRNGIILNRENIQFAQKEIAFAGFIVG